ncbi:hypothetical protein [Massilia sp. MS-15]|uniref:hypothetical protein n=1 Tax=Massilia sp. MS-15 TaxID=2878200 RepID=UPI001CD4DC9F|nr:hypothetical protein [Massilia sp. MS-15]MCA1247910.1 hypothetical protein [Massilia sp. MS-15]
MLPLLLAVVPELLPVLLPLMPLLPMPLLLLPLEPSALLPLLPVEPLRLPLLPAPLDADEPLCLFVLLPRLPELCAPLCMLPELLELLVPPTAPVLLAVAGLALLGEALALPRLLLDELLWLLPEAPLPWLMPEFWLLPMLEPAPSRLASLPFPSVDF